MKPGCYGRYSAHASQPCDACALRAPCAAVSSVGFDFIMLHRPRRKIGEGVVHRLVESVDDARVISDACERLGLQRRGTWWRLRGRRVASVRAYVGRVEVEVELLARRVSEFAAAQTASVHALQLASPVRKATPSSARRRREAAVGSVAVFADARQAAQFIEELVREAYVA